MKIENQEMEIFKYDKKFKSRKEYQAPRITAKDLENLKNSMFFLVCLFSSYCFSKVMSFKIQVAPNLYSVQTYMCVYGYFLI